VGIFCLFIAIILDYHFHLQAIIELCRVAIKEVRIYPLQGMDGKRYPFLDNFLVDLKNAGLVPKLVSVFWEFQKGSHQILRLTHKL
jgi:hypothetical protein